MLIVGRAGVNGVAMKNTDAAARTVFGDVWNWLGSIYSIQQVLNAALGTIKTTNEE